MWFALTDRLYCFRFHGEVLAFLCSSTDNFVHRTCYEREKWNWSWRTVLSLNTHIYSVSTAHFNSIYPLSVICVCVLVCICVECECVAEREGEGENREGGGGGSQIVTSRTMSKTAHVCTWTHTCALMETHSMTHACSHIPWICIKVG